jgi:uncharacterized protein YyaL (SSP411 family)
MYAVAAHDSQPVTPLFWLLQLGITLEKLKAILAECHKQLHAVRAKRPRPSLDDKVSGAGKS